MKDNGAKRESEHILRSYREAAHLTQEELAERAGVSVRSISNIERGMFHMPRLDTLRRIVEALGLTKEQAQLLYEATRLGRARHPGARLASDTPERDGVREQALVTSAERALVQPTLPVSVTDLLGREREASALTDLLLQHPTRLVTVTGPAGVGKTRLVLEVSRRLQHSFRDGVLFVSLAALDESKQVARLMLETLHAQNSQVTAPEETLVALLREQRLLLVLDNFEHLALAAPFVAQLIAGCPDVVVLVTSRAALHVRGEQGFLIAPLALPRPEDERTLASLASVASVALLLQRAQAIVADFALTNENAAVMAEICRRLDGLPLALELVAARLRLYTPQALLAQLEGRLALLSRGSVDLPARQQSLEATLTWSYDLLPPHAQALFRRLGSFSGDCSLSAAAAVNAALESEASSPEEQGKLVEILLEQHMIHLVVPEHAVEDPNEPRIGLLHTVRLYARERLEACGERERAEEAHGTYYTSFAERAMPYLAGPQQADWQEHITAEYANLRSALQWTLRAHDVALGLRLAGALAPYWYVRGEPWEGRDWLERILVLTEGEIQLAEDRYTSRVFRLTLAQALYQAAKLVAQQSDYQRAALWLERSASIARELEDTQGLLRTLNGLGIIAVNLGDFAKARVAYDECLALCRLDGDHARIAAVLNNLGNVAHEQGDYAAARIYAEESLVLARPFGSRRHLASVLVNLAELLCDQGDYVRARALCAESLAQHQNLRDAWGRAFVTQKLAEVARAEGNYDEASMLCRQSRAELERARDRRGLADLYACEGMIAQARGLYTLAADYHRHSLQIRLELGIAHSVVSSRAQLAHALRDSGELSQAACLYRQALAGFRTLETTRGICACIEGIALLACLRRQPKRASWLMNRARALRNNLGNAPTAYEQEVYNRISSSIRRSADEPVVERSAHWQ